jgi:hypothetical protein
LNSILKIKNNRNLKSLRNSKRKNCFKHRKENCNNITKGKLILSKNFNLPRRKNSNLKIISKPRRRRKRKNLQKRRKR